MSAAPRLAPFDLTSTFVHLADGPDAKCVPVTPDFWETIDAQPDLAGGRIVTASARSISSSKRRAARAIRSRCASAAAC